MRDASGAPAHTGTRSPPTIRCAIEGLGQTGLREAARAARRKLPMRLAMIRAVIAAHGCEAPTAELSTNKRNVVVDKVSRLPHKLVYSMLKASCASDAQPGGLLRAVCGRPKG